MKHQLSFEIIVPSIDIGAPDDKDYNPNEGLKLTMEKEGIVSISAVFCNDTPHGDVRFADLSNAVSAIGYAFRSAMSNLKEEER